MKGGGITMPQYDGTGPTGRGRGFHHWFGHHGRPWCWYNVDRKQALSEYRKALEEELEEVKKAEAAE